MIAVFKPSLMVVAVSVYHVSHVEGGRVVHSYELPPEGLQVPDGIVVAAGDYVVVQHGHVVLRVTEAEFNDNWFELAVTPVVH